MYANIVKCNETNTRVKFYNNLIHMSLNLKSN